MRPWRESGGATVPRARLVLAAIVLAIVGLTSALAIAQDHGAAAAPSAARAHGPSTGAVAPHAATSPADAHETAGAEAEHADEHGGAAHAGGHHGPADLNWMDIWDKKRPALVALFINFGVLMTLYYMLGKKPIAQALKQRRVTIGKDIDEAQKLLDEAKERAKKYQGSLNDAEVDAATAKAGLISSGKGEVERLLGDAQEKAERMKRDTDRLVEQERKVAHQDLLDETIELAAREAARLLQKTVTAEDHARLAQDLLLELARRPAARVAASTGRASVGPPPGSAAPPAPPAPAAPPTGAQS